MQPAPIIREAVLKAEPADREICWSRSSPSLDLATLQELNARVQVGGEPAKAVAEDYLKRRAS